MWKDSTKILLLKEIFGLGWSVAENHQRVENFFLLRKALVEIAPQVKRLPHGRPCRLLPGPREAFQPWSWCREPRCFSNHRFPSPSYRLSSALPWHFLNTRKRRSWNCKIQCPYSSISVTSLALSLMLGESLGESPDVQEGRDPDLCFLENRLSRPSQTQSLPRCAAVREGASSQGKGGKEWEHPAASRD